MAGKVWNILRRHTWQWQNGRRTCRWWLGRVGSCDGVKKVMAEAPGARPVYLRLMMWQPHPGPGRRTDLGSWHDGCGQAAASTGARPQHRPSSIMEGLYYNVKYGYVILSMDFELPLILLHSYIEGIVRGYRNALLTSQNYNNLTQCETIDGTLFAPHRLSIS